MTPLNFMEEINKIAESMVGARKAYYEGHPTMTDKEYDALEERVKQQQPDHPILSAVGHPLSGAWVKTKHTIPMGSLNKVHSEDEFRKWESRLPPDNTLVEQLKLDGAGVSADYEDSVFVRGATRGDGIEGEDISDNLRIMQGFVEKIKGKPFTGAVRFELMMKKEDLNRINSILPEDERYENTRNAAAGIARRLDGRFCQYLHMVAYDMTMEPPITEDLKIPVLKVMGFKTPAQTVGDVNDLVKFFNELKESRPTLEFAIDGTVIKVCDPSLSAALGTVGGRPRSQMAWKFDPPGAATTFLYETWDVGRTGVVTPLAILDPIKIEGSTISRATLHNVAQIQRLNLCRGDLIMLVKAGDVIPYLEEVIEARGGEPIRIPTECPSCGSPLRNDGVKLWCDNDLCGGKGFYRILNWIKVAKIDEFGESLAATLRDAGKLSKIADLYTLSADDIASLDGWGEQSARKIMASVDASRTLPQDVFLSAVGIPGVSEMTSEKLVKAFGTVDGVLQATTEAVAGLKGFSDISAGKIVSGLAKFAPEIRELMSVVKFGVNQPQSAGTFCFTGEMSRPRKDLQAMVVAAGGRNLSSVTKDLMYLVCNEDAGSAKSQKAIKLGTKVITEAEFLTMIGPVPEKKPKAEMPSLFE